MSVELNGGLTGDDAWVRPTFNSTDICEFESSQPSQTHFSPISIAHPFEHLVVEFQTPEQLGELCLQRFLAHIFAAAGGWMALEFIGVAGAMIIDISLLLDFADHRAAALFARNQAREGEVVATTLSIVRETSMDYVLNALPKLERPRPPTPRTEVSARCILNRFPTCHDKEWKIVGRGASAMITAKRRSSSALRVVGGCLAV